MKRSILILINLLAIILIAYGCSGSQKEVAQTTIPPILADTPEPTMAPEPTIQSGDFERKVMIDDLERSYIIHIPPDLNYLHAAPVLFIFHGHDHTPELIQTVTGLDEIADVEKFLVVYPSGLEKSWNTGEEGATNRGYATLNNVDDLEFIREILKDLENIASIDTKRIYAAGHSLGGMLVYRLACEMADTFAAIASVAGAHLLSECNPTQAVSLIHIHGKKDMFVSYTGDDVSNFPPVTEGIETWAELNECTNSVIEEDTDNGITHLAYFPCQSETAVELLTTDTGTHSWSGIGIPTSEVIWEFFAAHTKP